jgi:hypothetical protein
MWGYSEKVVSMQARKKALTKKQNWSAPWWCTFQPLQQIPDVRVTQSMWPQLTNNRDSVLDAEGVEDNRNTCTQGAYILMRLDGQEAR